MASVTFEDTILALNSSGWRLASLCQLYEGWYACVLDDEEFVHAGSGLTACSAIEFAITQPAKGRLYNSERAAQEAEEVNDKIDLAALGLVKQREPIKRRF